MKWIEKKYGMKSLFAIWLLSFLLTGLYFELYSAIVSALLLILISCQIRRGAFSVYQSLKDIWRTPLILPFVMVGAYLLSPIWAVDSGLAFWGWVKYLPILLFPICLMQQKAADRMNYFYSIPIIGAVMAVFSFGLQFLPFLHDKLVVNGRLGGAFQYPNTMACFMLIGIAILLYADSVHQSISGIWKWISLACLTFGLVQSGSRTVMVLAIPVCLGAFFLKKGRAILWVVTSLIAGGGIGYVLNALSAMNSTEHMMDMSLHASTFLGRLLYWKDALPIVLKHPFGLGYLGYYFIQGHIQTGAYTVRWVHNDLLQILLDIGWFPLLIFFLVVGKALLSKNTCLEQKIVLLILLGHGCMDFDLEFMVMYWILFLCLDWSDDCKMKSCNYRLVPILLAGFVGIASLYIGVITELSYDGHVEAALRLYPWDTLSEMASLTGMEDPQKRTEVARSVLERNPYGTPAWKAIAEAAYEEGDFGMLIEAEEEVLTGCKYSIEEYQNYYEMLKVGYQLYADYGDYDSAQVCLEEILFIQGRIDSVLEETDPLAWELDGFQGLDMGEDYKAFVDMILNGG